MKHRRFLHGAKFWVWVLLLGTYSAGAVGVLLVDAWEERYRSLSRVKLTTVQSDPDQRRAGAGQIAAIYRAQSGTPFPPCLRAVRCRSSGPMVPPKR